MNLIPKDFPKMTPAKKWGKWLSWGSLFASAAAVSAIAGASIALVAPLPAKFVSVLPGSTLAAEGSSRESKKAWKFFLKYQVERPVNILIMGIDRVLDAEVGSPEAFDGHSDTILLVRFDPGDRTLQMLSIPRDTQVFIPGVGVTKINDANVRGGAELAEEVVSETLNEIPIDRYIRVTNDAFRHLVDLVGGIEVDVPYAMQYKDATQQLEINLEPGRQLLNGDQAEQFARFRMDRYGDIGRVQRQQILLKALGQRLQKPAVLARLPQAVKLMSQYVDTNLSVEELLALVGFGLSLEKNEIKMVMLPGQFSNPSDFEGISYWLMSEGGRDRILQEYFDRPNKIATHRDRSIKRFRIAIQNATPTPEAAEAALLYLQERGFTNIYLSEATVPQYLSQSEIIVQRGDTDAAQALQAFLGIGRIEADSTGDIDSELTLRVGSDWLTQMPSEDE